MKADIPILSVPGRKPSSTSRNVTNLNIGIRKKARQVAAAAFMPGVFPNVSTASPKANDQSINSFRPTLESNFKIK